MSHRCSAAGSAFLHARWEGRLRGTLTGDTGVQSACDDPFQPHFEKVALLCLRMIGDPGRAADVAERAVARARRTIASSREARSFSLWLYSIVREECLLVAAGRSSELPSSAAEEVP